MSRPSILARWRVRIYSAAPGLLQRWAVRLFKPTYPLAVAVVVCDDHGDILLLHHTYGEPKWRLPGGLVERGEEVFVAAVREVAEEASCAIAPVAIADAAATKASFDIAVAARLTAIQPFSANAETCDRKWVNPAVASELSELQQRFIAAACRLL
ncbi:NUDIX hydrolase [Alicyclobacillus sp. ALC3]|uniref:NUDIX hydrolase n=1 Tax=Alicyclobacillus sp. ALC3 TaxID=2796143 RepID=UPI0023782BEE|nr:NUDIX domain-containing protein [Alicyclobacillus sp. ALC3]WDL98725.1 NUDIX domain-containing protein [Alicyclobacillus sp. ALC3]